MSLEVNEVRYENFLNAGGYFDQYDDDNEISIVDQYLAESEKDHTTRNLLFLAGGAILLTGITIIAFTKKRK